MPQKNLPTVMPGLSPSKVFLDLMQRIEKVSHSLKGSLSAMAVDKAKEDFTAIYIDVGDAYLAGNLDPMEVTELCAVCAPFHMALDLYYKK